MTRSLHPYALVLALASLAGAGVNVEIDPNAKAQGTLARPGEVDTFRFYATRGSQLVLTVKAAKKVTLDLAPTLTGPGDVAIDLTAAPKFKDAGKKLLVKGLLLPSTGTYLLRIAAEGTGDYSLRLQAKPQKRVTETLLLDAAAGGIVGFAAPAGAKVKITAKSGDGADPQLAETGVPAKRNVATLSLDDVEGGEMGALVTNAGAAGSVTVTVQIKAGKSKPTKVDVRAGSLGDPDGGESALSATVSAVAGGGVGVDDPDDALLGAGVDVPPGSLGADTRITMASATLLGVPDPLSQTSAGPAVAFGPDGLSFSTPASVTVPFDPSLVPVGADPDTSVLVVRESSDGSQQVIAPMTVDVDEGLVTVPTSGFSTFMAIVPRGTPQIAGLGYWALSLRLHMQPDDGGSQDSRRRDLEMSSGSVDFDTEGGFSSIIDERRIGLTHDFDGAAQVFHDFLPSDVDVGTWAYAPGGQGVLVTPDQEPTEQFGLSDDARALLSTNRATQDPSAELVLLLRRPRLQSQPGLPVGTYTFVGVSVRIETDAQGGPGGPAFLSRSHEVGTMTLAAGGALSVDATSRSVELDPAIGLPRSQIDRFVGSGTLRYDSGAPSYLLGSYLLETPPDTQTQSGPNTFRILTSADGAVLIGVPDVQDSLAAESAPFTAFIAVRRGTGLSAASLRGQQLFGSVGIPAFASYEPGGTFAPSVADFVFRGERTHIGFDGSRIAVGGPSEERIVERDPLAVGGATAALELDLEPFDIEFRIEPNGKFRTLGSERIVGGTTPNGSFGVLADDPNRSNSESGFGILIRLPPSAGGPPIDTE